MHKMGQMKGKASIEFEHPPVIISAGAVVGKKEGIITGLFGRAW